MTMRLIDAEKAWKNAQRIYSDPVLLHAIKNVLDSTETIEAAPVVHGRWIPVSERLPEDWMIRVNDEHMEPAEFLVFIEGAEIPTVLCFNGESFRDYEGFTYSVTHWMPLPEPPEEVITNKEDHL